MNLQSKTNKELYNEYYSYFSSGKQIPLSYIVEIASRFDEMTKEKEKLKDFVKTKYYTAKGNYEKANNKKNFASNNIEKEIKIRAFAKLQSYRNIFNKL